MQNEMLTIMGNSILRKEIHEVSTHMYSIIIDGAQDLSGNEQEAICLHYLDSDLLPHEDLVCLSQVSSRTGKELARMVTDVLLRLNLPLFCLRGQSYNGAANMAGGAKGVQAVIKETQPLALYIHCGPHCINLVTQTACGTSTIVSDALDLVHKLGNLYHLPGKYKTIFKEVAQSETASFRTLRPLCPHDGS